MNKTLALTALGVLALAQGFAPQQAVAQNYPTRPIRIIVPFTPGGATDILARLLSVRFLAAWGQATLVENRPGGAGLIGAELVVRSPPDGHMLLMSTASLAVNVTLFPKMPFNLRRDLAPITQVASAPIVIVVHPSVPARTLPELLKLAKSRKDILSFGSNGTGTTSHLAGELLQQVSGVKFTHVPFKGASGAMISLVSGEVEIGMPATTSARPHIAAGKLRGLAVTTLRKSSVLPELPTVASYFPGFDIDNWFSLFAPAGTPQAVINQLHAEAVKSLQHQDMKNFFSREGAEPVGSSPAELAAHVQREIDKYAKIVKTSGAKPDA